MMICLIQFKIMFVGKKNENFFKVGMLMRVMTYETSSQVVLCAFVIKLHHKNEKLLQCTVCSALLNYAFNYVEFVGKKKTKCDNA